MTFKKAGVVVVLAAALMIVACGKKKENPPTPGQPVPAVLPPSGSPIAPSANSSKTAIEGTWRTNCQGSDKRIQSIKVTNDVMAYVIEKFSDDKCTGPGQIEYQVFWRFALTERAGDTQYGFNIDYFDASGSKFYSEKLRVTADSLTLSSDDMPFVYLKVK